MQWWNKTQCQVCKRLGGPSIPFPGLVWSRVSPKDVMTGGHSTSIINIHLRIWPFLSWRRTNKQANKEPTDPGASLLFTSEKVAFCNIELRGASEGALGKIWVFVATRGSDWDKIQTFSERHVGGLPLSPHSPWLLLFLGKCFFSNQVKSFCDRLLYSIPHCHVMGS